MDKSIGIKYHLKQKYIVKKNQNIVNWPTIKLQDILQILKLVALHI